MAVQQQQQQQQRRRQDGRGRLGSGILVLAAVLAARDHLRRSGRETGAPAGPELGFLGSMRRNVSRTVEEALPGVMKGATVMRKALGAVRPYGLRRGNTIYGQSVCSDEINGDKGHLPKLMKTYYGHHFPLGGIGGAPYVGKTGFMAFSHHVPDDGHVVIVFGPHIGFSPQGEPGKFLRVGQADLSTSCGAVVTAYGQCTSGQNLRVDPQDAQQGWLRTKLKPHCAAVKASDNPMVDLVLKAYKAVEEELLAIVNTDFGSGNLVLLGGIQINMPYPMEGHFLPLHFSIRSASMEPVDLMPTFR